MSVNLARAKFSQLAGDIGEFAIHSTFPDDFEYYLLAFELVNSNDEILRNFVFPVNPSNISIPKINNSKVTKTASGVHVVSNPSFIPFDISISGNFGRKLRFITGNSGVLSNRVFSKKITKGTPFDPSVKSGYGLCKILEEIFDESRDTDEDGNPNFLYFYNLAFNSNYVVEPTMIEFSQNTQTNRIWDYKMSFKALAKLEDVQAGVSNQTIKLFGQKFLGNIGTNTLNSMVDFI